MKLSSPSRGTSFYESFSDLIFCALCLFILIIVALALQVGRAQENLEQEVQSVVVPNQYVGGAADTLMYSALIRIEGKPHVVFAPSDHSVNMSLTRVQEAHKLAIVRHLRENRYMVRPVEDLPSVAPGLGRSSKEIISALFCNLVQAYFELRTSAPGELAQLKTDEQVLDTMMSRFREQGFRSWLQKAPSRDWHARWIDTVSPMKELQPEGSFVRFSLAKDPTLAAADRETWRREARLRVGDLELTVTEFVAFMGAIKPGSGFVLEYFDQDSPAAAPPEVIKEEILEKTGYTGRVLSKAGQDVLQGMEK